MSENNFNDLPTELKSHIFQFLDKGSLKNAMLTCKLWNSIIESSCRWSLVLQCDNYGRLGFKKTHFILTTNRKFGKIRIMMDRYCFIEEDTTIFNIFKTHGFNVVKLYFSGGQIGNVVALAKLLSLTPNLKNAGIRFADLLGTSDVQLDLELPELKKLVYLKIRVDDYRIISCFRKAKIKTINLLETDRSDHHDSLVDFLSSQETLTSLTVNAHFVSPSILAAMGKLSVTTPFQLTHLAISFHRQPMSSHDQGNLLSFVKSQAKHLKKMEMGRGIPSCVYECVFASMTDLNSLIVSVGQIPQDNDFHKRLKENGSIRTIKLVNYGLKNDTSFLQKLPNIRSLIVDNDGDMNKDALVMAAQSLSKLESLRIHSIFESSFVGVKFPNLKSLQIQYLRGNIDWNEFTKIHPRLSKLTIKLMNTNSWLTNDDIDQITTNVDLQDIRLGYGFMADDRFFEIIRTKCTNLKVLALAKACISHGLKRKAEIDVLPLSDLEEFWRRGDFL